MKEKIELCGGKYEVVVDSHTDNFTFYANKYGENWRDLIGDKLIMAMFYRIVELESSLRKNI